MVVRGRVHDVIVPLAMGRHFGHDGGGSIDFLLVFLVASYDSVLLLLVPTYVGTYEVGR